MVKRYDTTHLVYEGIEESYDGDYVLFTDYEALERERDALIELLKVAACPANCTNGAYADNYGEPVQCQFCHEREQLIATKIIQE